MKNICRQATSFCRQAIIISQNIILPKVIIISQNIILPKVIIIKKMLVRPS